jgi:hypothetical protein
MSNKELTLIILAAVVVILVGWDIYAAFSKEKGDTISSLLLEWSSRKPVIALAIGVILGHLFWPQSK